MLLKDITNGEDRLLINYYQNFTDKRKNIFKILITVEKMTNCNNLFSKTGDSIISNFDFLKRFGTLYDLLLVLLNEKISTLEAPKEQEEMINKIDELKDLVLLEKQNITKKTKKKKKRQNIITEKSVLNNVLKLNDKRSDIINAFIENIYLTWKFTS